MVQTCSKCARANPADAIYCYHDGFVLADHGGRGGPVAVGSQPFHQPFVFPSGRNCRSFNELAIACQEEWEAACQLLQDGYLENFLAGQGRSDLAGAARQSARFPDRDRGLDQLLGKFPGDVLDEPKLRVDPLEINLGTLTVNKPRSINLHLDNQGMRLLYGSVSCSEPWLALGEATGDREKHFQFTHEQHLALHVRTDRLRAGPKPLEARLVVESNGGAAEISLRAEVPIKPFPSGELAGVKTPRQLAEKAVVKPAEAAALFEAGEVQRWYKDNGWTYPVQGPISSGKAGLQQYFEALGLAVAPKVELHTPRVALQGNPGERLPGSVDLRSKERRHIYAHGKGSQPWLEATKTDLTLGAATVHFTVTVPNQPGETVEAQLLIQSNGNQKFRVPVRVAVGHSLEALPAPSGNAFDFTHAAPAAPAPAFVFTAPEPAPVVEAVEGPEEVEEVREVPEAPKHRPSGPRKAVTPTPVRAPLEAVAEAPLFSDAPSVTTTSTRRRQKTGGLPFLVHLVPAALLFFAVLGVGAWDLIAGKPGERPGGDSVWDYILDDYDPLLKVDFHDRLQRFGLVMTRERDPKDENKFKRLTRDEDGRSNNTCLRIDEAEYLFDTSPGSWVGEYRREKKTSGNRTFYVSRRRIPGSKAIEVTQHVEIVPGVQSRRLDTCLVWYRLTNLDKKAHKVGLRVMLDTFIGANDGVPFVIPGKPGVLDKQQEFSQKEIPDYIQAIEYPDPENPGTVAHLGLKGIELPGLNLDPVTRMIICRWPNNSELRWELTPKEREPIRKGKKDDGDSCVFLYWGEQNLEPDETRDLAFTYGLGTISTEGAADLGLTAGGSFKPGSEFTVTAYVKEPKKDQEVTLVLPADLALAEGEEASKKVTESGEYGQVSWRVRADQVGTYVIHAKSGVTDAAYRVKIRRSGIFGSD